MISNDTDSVALLLRYFPSFSVKGLKELWIGFGKGGKKQIIPVHVMSERLGREVSSVFVKAHILTGL